jgi:hypothetical protein
LTKEINLAEETRDKTEKDLNPPPKKKKNLQVREMSDLSLFLLLVRNILERGTIFPDPLGSIHPGHPDLDPDSKLFFTNPVQIMPPSPWYVPYFPRLDVKYSNLHSFFRSRIKKGL